MINWIKGLFHEKWHRSIPTYFGMMKIGRKCFDCGYEYYEDRHGKTDGKVVKEILGKDESLAED